MLRSQEDHN